ncbi:MAG: hypothetical protein M1820_002228 [Bogoriella megaspora]|nr:MAG: hypothetical protein M1820_002228 [Bogoriella megaspora]
MSTPSITVCPPPGPSLLQAYNRTLPPTSQSPSPHIPRAYLDAMTVRHAVYVDEQHVPITAEGDDDDARSFHWIAYAPPPASSKTSDEYPTATNIPVATLRLVPPPHLPDPYAAEPKTTEPYAKIGRLATLREYRKGGLGRMLVDAAMQWAGEHRDEIMGTEERGKGEEEDEEVGEWKGLVLAHAQKEVQGWWAKMEFVVDEEMGEWDEEGIAHVGMWRRVDVKS